MTLLQQVKSELGLARFLVRHPRELRRVPRWLPERRLSPLAMRVPWWPYDAASWVSERLPSGARVFEYGGGGSTLWLEDLGAVVTVIEHDELWYRQLEEAVKPGTRLIHRGPSPTGRVSSYVAPGFFDDYAAAINDERNESLDLVIVDGRARVDCVRNAMPKVRRDGFLLLDDTGRARYEPAVALLATWERQIFEGLKPGDLFPAQTSVWRRPS
jgi:hypothetical protein